MARHFDEVMQDVASFLPEELLSELYVAIEDELADSVTGSEEFLNNTPDSD